MIRSARIPPILSRVSVDPSVQTAMLVTCDGELLGATSNTFVNSDGNRESVDNLGTLIADIAVDYQRLGEELTGLEVNSQPKKSHMQCLLVELDLGLVGISHCSGIDCLVVAIAAPDAPQGMVKERLLAIAEHVQEALSPLTAETTYR